MIEWFLTPKLNYRDLYFFFTKTTFLNVAVCVSELDDSGNTWNVVRGLWTDCKAMGIRNTCKKIYRYEVGTRVKQTHDGRYEASVKQTQMLFVTDESRV